MKKLLRFGIVGTAGFLIDGAVLMLLLATTPLGPFLARLVAIAVALGCTWFLNRSFTFGASRHSIAVEGFRYGSVGITSAVVNYLLYSALLISAPMLTPFAALVLASIAAMAFSFFGYSRFVFRR